jgi:hypothetical protein
MRLTMKDGGVGLYYDCNNLTRLLQLSTKDELSVLFCRCSSTLHTLRVAVFESRASVVVRMSNDIV